MLLLIPGDPLRPRCADPHFELEAEAARAAGHRVVLLDRDSLTSTSTPAPPGVPATRKPSSEAHLPVDENPGGNLGNVDEAPDGGAVYRGRRLRPGQYEDLAAALAARGVTLRTSAQQYRQADELPGWYPALAGLTPPSVWTSGPAQADFNRCRRELGSGPVVLRDYTTSMHHFWDEAAFVPEIAAAEAAWRVACRFLELRGADFDGGFVLRRYEDFDLGEARTWWVDGRCVLISAHPDAPHQVPPAGLDLTDLTAAIEALALPFVTVDLAHRFDGTWRVLEVADGQVAERPASLDPGVLIEALASRPAALASPRSVPVGD